jgi:hypothetical protein
MDGAFLGIDMELPGCHTVALAYRPAADLVGAAISIVTGVGLLAWGVARRLKGLRHA